MYNIMRDVNIYVDKQVVERQRNADKCVVGTT